MPAINKRRFLPALAALVLVASLGLAWAFSGPRPPGAGATEPVREDRFRDRRPSTPGKKPSSREAVDLLDGVVVSSDSVAGTWGFQDRALITPAVPWGRLQLPCVPPLEYDLRLEVTRKQGVDALAIGLVVSGVPALLVVDDAVSRSSWISLAGRPSPETY